MDEKNKKTSNRAKITDIAKPGKTAPSSSSRPVIVGNKNIVQDPMVSDSSSRKSEETAKGVSRSAPKVIAPLTDSEKTQDVNEAQADGNAVQSENQNLTTENDSDAPTSTSITSSTGVVDAVVDQALQDKAKLDKIKEAEAEKRQAEATSLINSKKYFVKTTQEIKKSRLIIWLMTFIFVSAIILYLLIDSSIIKSNINLPVKILPASRQPADYSNENPIATKDNKSQHAVEKDTADNSKKSFPARAKARDQERKNDLKLIRSMLETYYTTYDKYPLTDNWNSEINATEDLIKDPNGRKYEYSSDDGSQFVLKTKLENDKDPDATEGYYIIKSAN